MSYQCISDLINLGFKGPGEFGKREGHEQDLYFHPKTGEFASILHTIVGPVVFEVDTISPY